MNICVIGDSETVTGFALAGVKNLFEVRTSEEAWDAYQKDASKIVILSDSFSKVIDLKRVDDRVIVKVGGASKSNDLNKLIKETLGFEVRL